MQQVVVSFTVLRCHGNADTCGKAGILAIDDDSPDHLVDIICFALDDVQIGLMIDDDYEFIAVKMADAIISPEQFL